MNDREFCTRVHLEVDVVERWIACGWLLPDRQTGESQFTDIDVARAHLIRDLAQRGGVNDEGVDIVLHLLDQLHGLRRSIADLMTALREQPDQIRQQLAKDLENAMAGSADRLIDKNTT
jgi:chaperone modulatory protein CbpM